VYDYRCIRTFRFLRLNATEHPTYKKLIRPKLQDKNNTMDILDLGCCFGTDLRAFICDGANVDHVIGVDQYQQFIELGLNFFEDKNEKMASRFIICDIFDQKNYYYKYLN